MALFVRSTRKSLPTAIGQELYATTQLLFAAEASAHSILEGAQQLNTGQLRFGADAPINAMGILAAFRSRYPGVKIRLSTGNSAQIRSQVSAGQLDAGIVADGSPAQGITAVKMGSLQKTEKIVR